MYIFGSVKFSCLGVGWSCSEKLLRWGWHVVIQLKLIFNWVHVTVRPVPTTNLPDHQPSTQQTRQFLSNHCPEQNQSHFRQNNLINSSNITKLPLSIRRARHRTTTTNLSNYLTLSQVMLVRFNLLKYKDYTKLLVKLQ
jgi:hypothetical protein